MNVRKFKPGDEPQLWDLFYNTIRFVNARDYTERQVKAWAPDFFDQKIWEKKMRTINPFIVVKDDILLGYADLQKDGYIDHFYCHYLWQRKGVGSLLLKVIENNAMERGITRLYANVSITAKPFFLYKGFEALKKQKAIIRGEELENYKMQKMLFCKYRMNL